MNNTQSEEVRYFRLQALAEWAKLLSNIEAYGSYRYPSQMDLVTSHVLRLMGGWEAACRWEMRYLESKRNDFIELWIETKNYGKAEAMTFGAAVALEALPNNKKLNFNKFTKKLKKEEG